MDRSRLYAASVTHARRSPSRHAFRYRLYLVAIDLDEAAAISGRLTAFGYNRRAIVSLHDDDYGDRQPGSIRDKLQRRLTREGLAIPSRVLLVTTPRLFGYAFNPVSFYFCEDADGRLACVVAEVNNTFGERHAYFLRPDGSADGVFRSRAPKAFFVSPYFPVDGEYEFAISPLGRQLTIRISLNREGTSALVARLTGSGEPITDRALWKLAALAPFRNWLTMPRILWQAARLSWQRGLRMRVKPAPVDQRTLRRAPPTFSQRFCQRIVFRFFSRMRVGRLKIVLPDGAEWSTGDPGASARQRVKLQVNDWRFFPRAVRSGEVGFGESYVDGEWDCDQLQTLIELLLLNQKAMNDADVKWTWLGRWLDGLRQGRRHNTIARSKQNVADHYDLGNDLYRAILDESMTYSSAIFESAEESLASAQLRKIDRVARKSRIRPEHHILEIGCGWGSFAINVARRTGCRVTGITLSEEQLRFARERVAALGLDDRVDLRLCDYRQVTGQFDRIVSIEMLEAVGHEFMGEFFAACDRLLKPEGLMVLQTIAYPDQAHQRYRQGNDWIRKHIFPGGRLPSLTEICKSATARSSFLVEHVENIGAHYAPTLRHWCERMHRHRDRLLALGHDAAFLRKWDYYFSSCAAGFATRWLSNYQIVLTRWNNQDRPTPEEIYGPGAIASPRRPPGRAVNDDIAILDPALSPIARGPMMSDSGAGKPKTLA